MTTIACNRDELYGDLQYTNGSLKWKGKTKVFKFKAHPLTYEDADFIVGFTGAAGDVVSVSSYFSFPDRFPKLPRVRNCGGLVLTADRDIFCFDHFSEWMVVDQEYMSIGSGSPYALGALAAGASPKEAVKNAMKYDIYSGLGIKGARWT